jgi:predicted DNA-binding transcriptional regulator AlpA
MAPPPTSHIHVTERRYLTKKTVASRNGVHTGTLDRWVRLGRFPRPVKLSAKGGCRWPEQVILDWEKAQLNNIPAVQVYCAQSAVQRHA